MTADIYDRWSIARNKVDEIMKLRLKGRDWSAVSESEEATIRAENLTLVLEVERQRMADRQTEAQERAAKAAEAAAMGINAMVATTADLAAGLNALVATIKSIGITVEDLADHDQGELFKIVDDPGPCACGKDHSEVD